MLFFTITAQLTLHQCLQHILNIYIQYCLQLHFSTLALLFIYAFCFSQCDIFPHLLNNLLYNSVYSISSTYAYSTVYNYTTQYTDFAVYICFLYTMWHFFTITAQVTLQQCLQHILSIYIQYYLQLLSPVYCLCCLHMLSFSQCDIFPQLLHNWLYNNVYSISSTYTYGIVTITLPSILTLLFIYASFTQCDIFSQLLPNWLYNNVYSISATYTYSTVCNYSPQYTGFAVYICFPFHNVIFFHNDCTIHSTTMFTAYSQHIHTVLFTITLPSILSLLLHMLYFSQYDIFSQLLHNWLYNNVYSISSTYTYLIVYNYITQYTDFAVYICFLYTMWHFFTITAQELYNNVYSISATYTYSTVYNYSPQYTGFAVYICFLYTMWHFFTMTAQLTLQQCLQHILNIYIRYCLQLHYPVYWLCCLYMLPLHNVTFFHNYCPIDSTTMSTAYPQHIHIVLFATTPHSILALLFIYAFLFTMWYFSTMTAQLTLQQCLQHILNIYVRYCYNYTTQYTDFAVYICFLYTMWHFFTITAQLTLQQCLQHIRNIYI